MNFFEKYGDPTASGYAAKWLIMYDTPKEYEIGVIPKRVYCHKDFAPVLDSFFKQVVINGLAHHILTWDGCYNVRPIRGYEKKFEQVKKTDPVQAMKYLSVHSWGCAFDINAAWNRLGQEPTINRDLVDIAKSVGLTWGGDFKRKDGMHFELR